MSAIVLRGSDVQAPELASLVARTPETAMALLEGPRGAFLGPLTEMPDAPERWSRGTLFWPAGELRWVELEPGRMRVRYAGDEEAFEELPELVEAEEFEGARRSETRMIASFTLADGVHLPPELCPSSGALLHFVGVEYVDSETGAILLSRLCSLRVD